MSNDIKVGKFSFSAPIQIHKFYFEQVGKRDGKPKKIIQNIDAVALQDDNAYMKSICKSAKITANCL